jgi:hypothetical protein|nr:MAG TPA: hypothetical protein [Caudoviricetes sp.]DAX76137.1 MAG TPA: hypothetical protein [Caudoviricetes sp.]
MVKKLVQASMLLKEKGYVEEKFDQQGFTECIYNWFKEHDLKDKLLIRPKRFIEMDNPPKGGWLDMTNVDEWIVSLPWEQQLLMLQKGTAVPFIWVDKPFMKNAMYMLQVMNGFIVEKGKKGVYEVSLI